MFKIEAKTLQIKILIYRSWEMNFWKVWRTFLINKNKIYWQKFAFCWDIWAYKKKSPKNPGDKNSEIFKKFWEKIFLPRKSQNRLSGIVEFHSGYQFWGFFGNAQNKNTVHKLALFIDLIFSINWYFEISLVLF